MNAMPNDAERQCELVDSFHELLQNLQKEYNLGTTEGVLLKVHAVPCECAALKRANLASPIRDSGLLVLPRHKKPLYALYSVFPKDG